MTEHAHQVALVEWTAWESKKTPELELLFACPNGGERHGAVAAKLKAEGVKAGVPDLFLPVPKQPFHGLFIEMKHGKNTTTEAQRWWLRRLKRQGYEVAVCYSCDEAIERIKGYLS